jgi:hypothetical protein
MEVMVSLLNDTPAKVYRSSEGRIRPWWRLAAFFLNMMILFSLVDIACQFDINTLQKLTVLEHFY